MYVVQSGLIPRSAHTHQLLLSSDTSPYLRGTFHLVSVTALLHNHCITNFRLGLDFSLFHQDWVYKCCAILESLNGFMRHCHTWAVILLMPCCFAGGRFLDGRVWPLEDELEVRLMIDLIRHVTGAEHPPPLLYTASNCEQPL